MKKTILFPLFTLLTYCSFSQTASDFFIPSEHKVSWLGIDFSHVKLIGDFNHFFGAGSQSAVDIRDEYFNRWNKIVLTEPDKYDIRSMLRKADVFYDVAMITGINSSCSIENLEDFNTPNYSIDDIREFVNQYPIENKSGFGVLMIAESLNKPAQEAYFHFLIINMSTKEILIHDRIRSEPTGFGLRNYWAGAIYRGMKQIKDVHYQKWKGRYK